jgi:hypothetical protein
MEFLKKRLQESPNGLAWKEISKHGKIIGLKEDQIRQLLFLAGAEPSAKAPFHWKVTSAVRDISG